MTIHERFRGLVLGSVFNTGPDEIFAQLKNSVDDFKRRHSAELAVATKEIDNLNAVVSAMKIGGAGDGSPGAGADHKVYAAVSEFIRLGNPDAMIAFSPSAAMTTDSAPDGGFTVPKEIDAVIQNLMIPLSPMRGLAAHVSVSTSEYKKLINKRGATTGWAGERDPRTETDTPSLGEIAPPMGEIWAYPSVTKWALDDSQFNLENFIRENIVDEFAQQEAGAFVKGNGIKKPLGFLSLPKSASGDDTRPFGTLQFVNSGGASGFAASAPGDAFIDLIYSVAAVYRAGDGVGWMMNSSTAGRVRKFKDGQGNYLWQEATQKGQPALLAGYPVYESEDMPDVAADAYPVAFGNFQKGYLIVDRTGVSILRDPYTKPGWVRFFITKRVGGAPTDTQAIKLMRIAA